MGGLFSQLAAIKTPEGSGTDAAIDSNCRLDTVLVSVK